MENCSISLCFRPDDGKSTAERIYNLLEDQPVPWPSSADCARQIPRLDVRLEQDAAEGGSWEVSRKPHLRRSHALVVVCSPGIKYPVDVEDWVHRDIVWWLEHRESPPILIDPMGTGSRWVPQSIAEKFPSATPIRMLEREWDGLTARKSRVLDARTRARLLTGLVSCAHSYKQNTETDHGRLREMQKSLEEQRQLSEQLKATLAEQQQTSQELRASLNRQKETALELRAFLLAQQSRSRHWRWAFGIASVLLATKVAVGVLVPL